MTLTEGELRDLFQAKALLARILRSHEMRRGRIAREDSEARAALRQQREAVEDYEERN